MKLVLSVSAIGEQAEGRCRWMWMDLQWVHGWRRSARSSRLWLAARNRGVSGHGEVLLEVLQRGSEQPQ